MPQMMPMKWTFILIFSLIMLIFLINFNYFFYTPKINYLFNKNIYNYWHWKW